jgi:4'-phosphopantetheinyl transferase
MNADSRPEILPWKTQGPPVDLAGADLHLWCLDLAAGQGFDLQQLRVDEQDRALRLLIPHKREQFIRSRSLLRLLLGTYLAIEPLSVRLGYGQRGKPQLDPSHNSTLRFNLAHSGDLALLAVSLKSVVGIDIERIDPRFDFMPIAKRYFSGADYNLLREAVEPRRRRLFYRIWTRIEALGKLSGKGIGNSFASEGSVFTRSLFLAPHYVCTLATEDSPQRIARFHFKDL